MNTTTRRATSRAANWSTRSLCRQTDPEDFFQDDTHSQEQAQGVCRGCPVRSACLTDILGYEEARDGKFGVVGGLTPVQRRALRVEKLLGSVPDLGQASMLARPWWAGTMSGLKYLPPAQAAQELRGHGVLATPVTVRLALWWTGSSGSLLAPKRPGDRRQLWERVRDETQDTVERLRAMDLGRRDVAAYLGVSEDALYRATTAWNRAAEAVAA